MPPPAWAATTLLAAGDTEPGFGGWLHPLPATPPPQDTTAAGPGRPCNQPCSQVYSLTSLCSHWARAAGSCSQVGVLPGSQAAGRRRGSQGRGARTPNPGPEEQPWKRRELRWVGRGSSNLSPLAYPQIV